MKQDNGKKTKKWLLIVIAIVALLAAAAVAAVFIFGGNQGENQGETPVDDSPTSAVYWNLDRVQYTDPETGLSTREKGDDGLYTVRMISGGKIIEMKTADKQLINYIDTMDAFGLVLDENGLIIDVLNVKDIAVENAKNFYVKRVDGNTITVNSSIAMNGMDITLVLTDAASIVDVRPGSETLGQPVELQVFDMVSVYSNKEEVVTAVFLHERPESSPLYLRVDRMYDSATASTTREPDKNGIYTIPFAMGGKVLQLKCKDKNIVTGLDSGTDSKQVMGLTFDEEGYITGSITAATAARGRLLCQVYNVTAINGNNIEATRLMSGSEQGKVVNFNLTEETEIVMNENGCNHFIGEYVEDLKIYDRVVVWTDMDSNAMYIKIDRRKVEGDDIAMYYLKGKQYDSTNKVTSRVPVNGYYVYELASKGKMVTVKTKDKDIATLMDGNSYQFFGLKVKGGIIQEYYDKDCLSGGYGVGGQRFVTDVMANIVRIASGSDFNSGGTYMLTDKTEIYNMTGYNGKLGSKTTLQVGDRVILSRDVENNITHIYVLDRPVSGSTKFYYNASRKYDSTNGVTTRTTDADGYYVYTMYCEGKEVTVKTKDKEIATIIDEQNAPIAAMKVNKDGIVTAAYPAIAGKKYASKVFNYNYVGEITKDKVVSAYYYSNGVKTAASKSYPMAKNCQVYNVSTNYTNYRGEKTSLKVGDRIQALLDLQTGELTHIWVMGRMIDSPLYLNPKTSANTYTTPDADGYYSIELFVDGKMKTFRTKDLELSKQVYGYSSETFFAMKTDGDIILRADASSSSKNAANTKVSFQDIVKISGKTITTERKRPGQSNTGATVEFTYTSKTKIYDVCYYSENQYKPAKLEKGDRISVYADLDGNITYIFVMYPHTREKGYEAKCSHCNKTVWWEPYLGSFIKTAETVHYYYPTDRDRSKATFGSTNPDEVWKNAILDMNGCRFNATAGANFDVYANLVLIDSVGGGSVSGGDIKVMPTGSFSWNNVKLESNLILDGSTVAMSGVPNFTGVLVTKNGGKVDISKLSTDARILALPDGVFTTESNNIDAYLDVFIPGSGNCSIAKQGKALTASISVPSVTDNLDFVPNTQVAACATCQSFVTWTPITQETYGNKARGTTSDGMHLYLAEDIEYTASETFMYAPSKGASICVHLNGHNFTATSTNFIHGYPGTVYVMGNGTVTGNGKSGAAITANTNASGGCINLLSGTYTKAAGNTSGVVQINSNGGSITIGKDAVIKTEEDELAVKIGGGSYIDSNLIIQGTVEGGYVESVKAVSQSANDTDGEANGIYLAIDGGNLKGGAKLAADTIIGLSGAAKVGGSGLNLTSGAKILVSELTEGASVAVAANGVFTENINLETQQNFYVPAPKYLPFEIVGQTLSTSRDPNAAPDLPKDPATPAKPALLSVDNSNLALNDANEALCPVCNKTVVWTAITDATETNNLEGEKHYYLANNITYEGESCAISYDGIYNGKVTCLHLNGYNITATAGKAIYSGGYLNVMGNGIVSGNGTVSHRGATVEVNSSAAKLNLYGGTYLRDAANNTNPIINVHGNGGIINLYDGAVVDGRELANYMLIRSWCGEFNMYGGTVYGGSATAVSGSNWTYRSDGTGSGTINIYGGLIEAGSGAAVSVGGAKKTDGSMVALGHLGIYGGTIKGNVAYNANTVAVIGGNPVLTRLTIPSNMSGDCNGKFTLGRLTAGASITVYGAEVIFTNQSENAQAYIDAGYIKAQSGKEVYVKDYALALKAGGTTPEPETPTIPTDPAVPALPSKLTVDNSNLSLDGSNQAKCPVCDVVVTWTAITSGAEVNTLIGDMHYYLANDITYEGTDAAIRYPYSKEYSRHTTCLHLNGKNVTATNGLAIFAGNYLNIMGNGNLTGNKNANGRAVVLEVNSSVALVNVYGGNYAKANADNTYAVVQMNTAGGILNFYEGVSIDNAEKKGPTVRSYNGTINVYGGFFKGGSNGSVFEINNGLSTINNVPNTPVAGTLNFFGGKAHATANYGLRFIGSADINVKANLYGGEIMGTTVLGANTDLVVGGTVVMNRLKVETGYKFTLAEMKAGASVGVLANGIFTKPSSNATTYVGYFYGQAGYKTPTVVENALFTEEGTDPENPGGTTPEPEQPAAVDYNKNLEFTSGTTAYCPVCEKDVEWTAITQEINGENPVDHPSVDGMHYYLAEDITYTGTASFIQGPGSSKTLCIHLNGHNWTGTKARFLFGYGSKSRVMGNGIVASGLTGAGNGGIAWNTSTKTNVDIQLYGGTYTVTPENTTGSPVSIQNNGGDITIHEGATVIGSPTAPAIFVGNSGLRTSVLTIKGAKVYGSVLINSPKTPATYATTIVVEEADLNVVQLAKNVSFTVKGNTTIEKLVVEEGAKFTVGELGANAKINVQGNGVISEANTAMATYFGKVTSTYGCELSVVNNAIVARDLNKIDNSNLEFAENSNKAVCPYCQVEVEWEALSDASAQIVLQAKKHYYLANNLDFNTISNTGTGLMYDFYGLNSMTCLHLNGKNITSNGRAIYPGGYLNIMGNGVVSGNYTQSNIRGATIDVNANTSSRLNLLGGTYTKNAANTTMPVIAIFVGGGNINMYAGATVDGGSVETVGNPGCLLIKNDAGKNGNFTMYGGTIKGGINSTTHGGNIYVGANGNFTMYGGTVTGGKAPINYGGNIFASGGTLNLLGGTVTNGSGRMGGNIATQKNITAGVGTVMVLKNVTISNGKIVKNPEVEGSVAHGGNISIERTTLTIEDGTYIYGGDAEGQGGNIRALYCNITMNGGYITGGKVGGTNTNENIWLVGSNDEKGTFTMNGGVIYANSETVGAGSGISAGTNTTITLAGDAIVISNPANPNKPIKTSGDLVKDPSWTGIGASNKD